MYNHNINVKHIVHTVLCIHDNIKQKQSYYCSILILQNAREQRGHCFDSNFKHKIDYYLSHSLVHLLFI
jgi:hypothetical protein